jgi:hypothetical protein
VYSWIVSHVHLHLYAFILIYRFVEFTFKMSVAYKLCVGLAEAQTEYTLIIFKTTYHITYIDREVVITSKYLTITIKGTGTSFFDR